MAKKQKRKAETKDATRPGSARKSAVRAIDPPVSAASKIEAVSASDGTPQPLQDTAGKLATSSDVPTTSLKPPAARQVDVIFGQIVAILMRSPQHKFLRLADLEWLVLPAVLGGQYSVAQAQLSDTTVPVGLALWTSVSPAVDLRLSDLSAPGRLQPDEWRSGDIPWLLEVVADAQTRQLILTHLGDTVFKGREIKMRLCGADGKLQIGTFKGVA
jgi:cytolysin-activating lysine-acyltransferase